MRFKCIKFSIKIDCLSILTAFNLQVRAEDIDILIILVFHCQSATHEIYFVTNQGTFNVKQIHGKLTAAQKKYLLFVHAFTGNDTVSAISRHGKQTLFDRLVAYIIFIMPKNNYEV